MATIRHTLYGHSLTMSYTKKDIDPIAEGFNEIAESMQKSYEDFIIAQIDLEALNSGPGKVVQVDGLTAIVPDEVARQLRFTPHESPSKDEEEEAICEKCKPYWVKCRCQK